MGANTLSMRLSAEEAYERRLEPRDERKEVEAGVDEDEDEDAEEEVDAEEDDKDNDDDEDEDEVEEANDGTNFESTLTTFCMCSFVLSGMLLMHRGSRLRRCESPNSVVMNSRMSSRDTRHTT